MFAGRYFTPTYYPPGYFPETGSFIPPAGHGGFRGAGRYLRYYLEVEQMRMQLRQQHLGSLRCFGMANSLQMVQVVLGTMRTHQQLAASMYSTVLAEL